MSTTSRKRAKPVKAWGVFSYDTLVWITKDEEGYKPLVFKNKAAAMKDAWRRLCLCRRVQWLLK